ncbi:MAG: protein translocase subunit SecD, partial [Pseudomonadota bacterium]
MLYFAPWKKISILLVCLLGIVFAMPNLWYESADQASRASTALEAGRYGGENQPTQAELQEQVAGWPSFLPPNVVNLGLDLRGGVHLLVEVQVEEVWAERILNLRREVFDALRREQIRRKIAIDGDVVRVEITNPADQVRAGEILRGLSQPIGGGIGGGFMTGGAGLGQGDLTVTEVPGGYTLEVSEAGKTEITNRTMAQSLEIMRRRIDETGTREPAIQRQGDRRILIQVPGLSSSAELLEIIGKTAKLTFHDVVGFGADADGAGPGEIIVEDEDGQRFLLDESPVLSGESLVDAQLGFNPDNGLPVVNFRFDSNGARIFGEYTAANQGRLFAIVLDDVVITAPRIRSPILGGSGFIEGDFTVESATNLAILLRAGALPASISVEEERTVGPDLGADSIAAGKLATILAFVGILIFMGTTYGRFGLFANIALIVNVALIFGFLSAIGATLTLPGIAGIVLTIGMAVDANVLIFERIREELKGQKSPSRAVERGYEQAFSAIIDANITTFIAAVILFAMGSGPVKGFAVTLGVGIITSVFTATLVTRFMVSSWLHSARPKSLKIGLFRLVAQGTKINFMGGRRIAAMASAVLVASSVGGAAVLGLNFGIDFKGGTLVEVQTQETADLGEIRAMVSDLNFGEVAVQNFGSERDVLIRVEAQAEDSGNKLVAQTVEETIESQIAGAEV